MNKKKKKTLLEHLILHILLIPAALTMLLPFVWMASTSFKEAKDIFTFPPTLFGQTITLENYRYLFEKVPFVKYIMNSLKIAGVVTAFQLFTSSLAGYVFARLRFPARDKIFLLYLGTMMVPGCVTLIPNFIVFRLLGIVDTHMSLILPAISTAFGTFFMRQFFQEIPDELEQAAKVDGCSLFGIYWRIFLPLSKTALVTLGIFIFNGAWTDYLGPLVYIISPEKMTLTVGVAALQGTYATNWGVLMASLCISVLPVLIIFLLAQDVFVKGIALSGIKA